MIKSKRANGKGSVTMRKDANRAKPVMVRATVNGKQVYIGDAEKDITKGVYTHKTIAQLRKTIALVP